MDDTISNGVLLQHMQGMKNDLQAQISGLGRQISGINGKMERLDGRMDGLDQKLSHLESKMDRGFEDARLHRQALQEDLEETMRVQGRHGVKLARL